MLKVIDGPLYEHLPPLPQHIWASPQHPEHEKAAKVCVPGLRFVSTRPIGKRLRLCSEYMTEARCCLLVRGRRERAA